MKKTLLIIAITLLIFQMVVLATAINIGSPGVLGNAAWAGPYTVVNKNGSANGSGTITKVWIYATTALVNCEVATFSASGNNLTTRDTEYIGAVPVYGEGPLPEFNVNLNVQDGDYIGISYFSGTCRSTSSGGSGIWYASTDYIPCSSQAFDLFADAILSVGGTGETAPPAGWPHKWNTITIGKWNTTTFTKWNGI